MMKASFSKTSIVVMILLIIAALDSAVLGHAVSGLTLQQAVRIALEKNPLRKAALADTKASGAGVRGSRAALFPNIMFSEIASRGNDPVFVFGSRLRQQRFTVNDFALNRLNTPTPFGNFGTRFSGTWSLFDSMATWRRIEQAKSMQDAAGHQLERTDQEVVLGVVNAYYNVLLAKKRLEVAEQAVKTSQAVLDSSKARYDAGLSVQSDLLNAQVRMASRQQEAIAARNAVAMAEASLNVAMGIVPDVPQEPLGTLAERTLATPSLAELEKTATETRPDLKRIRSEESAQKLSVAIAKSSFGPRVNAFASWEADNPTFLAGGGGNNWTSGIELQLDLFTGGAKRAELSRQKALEDKVAALRQAAELGVRLEVRRAYYDNDSAQKQVEVARAAVDQAQESLRISQNRYQSGLTTITDLLNVEDAARRTQLDHWEALYRYYTSYANLELAAGTLNPDSPVVKP